MIRTLARRGTILAATALLGACAQKVDRPRIVVEEAAKPATGWRSVARDEDVAKIEALQAAWAEALDAARRRGFSKQITAEGPLLEPAGALPRAAPSPGAYMCRLIRMGPPEGRGAAFNAFKPFFCNIGVNGEQLSITKQTGSERPAGYLWEEEGTSKRLIFLGSLALGNEDAPLGYGDDPSRDMAGIFERVATFRYRLVIPRPRGTSKLDVIELVPAPVQVEE
jgi:hypothetical protein